MKIFRLLLFIFFPLSISQEVCGGFVSGTLVKIPDGYEAIENLVSGSMVCSFDEQGNSHISKVKRTISYFLSRAIIFELKDDVIIAAPYQKYYVPCTHSWQEAEKIKIDAKLCSLSNEIVEIQNVIELHNKIEFFDIQLEDVHTFCVTRHDIVVHNFPPFFIGLGFAWGGGVVFKGIYGGLCVAGLWLGTKILKKGSDSNNSDVEIQVTALCDAGLDNKDDYIYLDKSVEDILKETTPGQKTKGRAKQYVKPGGYEDAIKDFDNLGPISVEDIPGKKR